MVDIGEAYSALNKTPENNIKQRLSFVYKLFFDKAGQALPINIITYSPGMQLTINNITIIRNFKIKLKNSYALEQDFIVIPSRAGNIFIPLNEIPDFCNKIISLAKHMGINNEN